MNDPVKNQLVPYHMTSPGFEAVYTGRKVEDPTERLDCISYFYADEYGNEIMKWSTWGMMMPGEEKKLCDEQKLINKMQENLGELDDKTRQIRAHIGSLVLCDNGVPVTIDEILDATGRGELREPSFHNGCWMPSVWWEEKSTQPFQDESMQGIELILSHYLSGQNAEDVVKRYPYAEGFIKRTYEWLGPVEDLSEVQKMMIDRLMLPFDYLTKRTLDYEAVQKICFEEGGRGEEIDIEIASKAGLPKIYPNYMQEYRDTLKSITDPEKKELYKICGMMAHGLPHLSDCHHSTFRRLERWIHGIGTGKWEIIERIEKSERTRLGHLLYGYAFALDKWLMDIPMQSILLDLGYIDLYFNPKNEILRVYAYLTEDRSPVKEWLMATMWYKLVMEPPASLYKWGWAYRELLQHTEEKGLNLRTWIDQALNKQ